MDLQTIVFALFTCKRSLAVCKTFYNKVAIMTNIFIYFKIAIQNALRKN